MARSNTRSRSLLSEADLEDTGGLLAAPRGTRAPTNALAGQMPTPERAGVTASAQPEPAALTPEQWQRILSGEAMSIGDAYYTAERIGANASMDQWDEGALTGRVMRVPVSGNQYQMLDSAGNVEQTLDGYRSKGFFGDLLSHAGSIAKDTAPVWLAALGANFLAPGAAGAAEAAGAAGGTAAAAAPITDAATAAFLEANMGALAPTVSGGFAPVAAASTLAPEVIASTLAPEAAAPSLLSTAAAAAPELATVAPELAGSGLLAPQTITVTGSKAAAATTPWWAPAAVAAPAVPVLGGMTATPTVAEAFRPSQNYGEGMTGAQTSAYDGVINATGSPALANAAANVAGAGSSVVDFVKANPTLGRLLFSGAGALLNTVGGPSGSSPGGYVDSGYRPNISRGGFNAAPQARQMAAQPTGLLMAPGRGEANSGLWRYAGLLDGAAGPSAPQMTPAMTPPRVTPPPTRATPPTTERPVVAPAAASAPTTAAARASSTGVGYELPSWAFKELGPTEKAALYNSFRSRGFNDDYIRTIVNRTQPQPDSDWSALTQLARQLPQGLIAGDQVPTKATIQQAVAGWRAQQPAAPQSSAQPTAPPAVQPAADAPIGVPYVSPAQRLKNYAYEGGANDDVATRRGLGYARLMGWSPDEAVRNWNEALGTRFTTDDYQRALQAYGFTSGGLLGG